MSPVQHTCAACGVAFVAWPQAHYCSRRCRKRASYWRNIDAARARQHGRYVRIVQAPQACMICGQVFTPHDRRGRYCSAACRQRAFWQRHAPS